ncbi:MAG: DUF4934 domain-containing protein [Parabacteroides sp.]|nr:DUF4934 domain-containing protein [Parabacteroides sp.]
MKKHMLCYILTIGCGMLLSCNSPSAKIESLETISVGKAYANLTKLKVSDYFQTVRYVPLETNDSVLVGDNPKLCVYKDLLIVSSPQEQCYAFSKGDGWFLHLIGHIGNDPEGCSDLVGWLNAASGYLYFNRGNKDFSIYHVNGQFVGTTQDIETNRGLFGIESMDYLDAQMLVKHLPATNEKPDRIILFQDTTRIATFPTNNEKVSGHNGDFSNSVGYDFIVDVLGGRQMLNIEFGKEKHLAVIVGEHPFWHVGEKLYFREHFNDTIYQVTKEGLLPERRFDFGDMTWKREDRYDTQKDHAIYPMEVQENDRILWLRFLVDLFDNDKRKAYNALYLKETGEVKVAAYEEGLENDLNGFLPLQPTFVTVDGEFAQIIPAETIAEWFEEHPDVAELPEEVKALKGITTEDNPVVVLMK